MTTTQLITGLKDTALGTIVLGAIGSLLAVVIAFFARDLTRRFNAKREKRMYDLGYISAYADADMKYLPPFMPISRRTCNKSYYILYRNHCVIYYFVILFYPIFGFNRSCVFTDSVVIRFIFIFGGM